MIGDPMLGAVVVSKTSLNESYDFTGFFMMVGRPDT